MRLWDDEVEALRREARSVTIERVPTMQYEMPVPTDLQSVDLIEAATIARKALMHVSRTCDRAVERVLGGVPCRVFVPPGEPTAVLMQFHGGGMVVGGAEWNDLANASLVDRYGVGVVAVRYRLAPEHPYPAAIDDCVSVARWLLRPEAAEFGRQPRIITAGRSGGGYLALMVLLRMREEGADMSAFIGSHLVHGMHDWGCAPSHIGRRPTDLPDLIRPEEIAFFTECWLPGRSDADRRDPLVSTAWADLSGLPPAHIAVATGDHLFDDSLILASRWAAAGGDIDLFVAPEMPHGFTELPCAMTALWSKRSDEWWRRTLAG
jgi:acetyl esterase